MTPAELDQLEAIIDMPDQELLAWATRQAPVPATLRSRFSIESSLSVHDRSFAACSRGFHTRPHPSLGVPQGLDAMLLPRDRAGSWATASAGACGGRRPAPGRACRALAFFAPELEVLRFPAWDCLPYDRVSPAAEIVARRLATLTRLHRAADAAR